ncbi:MAG: PAS domain S-box protein [Syntrophotaleaceae bacterium]
MAISLYQGERFIYANPAMERLLGFDTEELCGMKILDGVHEDYKELVRSRAMARLEGESVPCQYEIKCVTKAGEELCLLLSAGKMEYPGAPHREWRRFSISLSANGPKSLFGGFSEGEGRAAGRSTTG